MAADQRRKRLKGPSIVGCSSKEHQRIKKKNLGSVQNGMNLNSQILLEWNDNEQKVVAKRDQIGLSWRDLKPFLDSARPGHSKLADVASVPSEIFELDNLVDVLSVEVWQTHLSDSERDFLKQFLPKETEVETDALEVLQPLLAGDNINFGNPSLKWCGALCSGNLHPDVILQQEDCLKALKRRYYLQLQKYHYDMISYLQKLKKRWEICEDPEKEILQKMSRRGDPRSNIKKKICSSANDATPWDLDRDAASESCSWTADEKAFSSDNQNSSAMVGELQKRTPDTGFKKGRVGNSQIAINNRLDVGGRVRKQKKLQKHSVHPSDGDKYMSYLKISKKQHQIVTSMKPGKSLQLRSLDRVLGNLDILDVQPYEVFVEEEKKKLHEHWLQLTKDIPRAYAAWRDLQLQKQEMTRSLERDLKDKLNSYIKVETEDSHDSMPQDMDNISLDLHQGVDNLEGLTYSQEEDRMATDHEYNMEDGMRSLNSQSLSHVSSFDGDRGFERKNIGDGADSAPRSTLYPSLLKNFSPKGGCDLELVDIEEDMIPPPAFPESYSLHVSSHGGGHENKLRNVEDNTDSFHSSLQNQELRVVSSVTSGGDFKLKDTDCLSHLYTSKSDNTSSALSERTGTASAAHVTANEIASLSSGREMWPAVSMANSYYGSSSTLEYTPTIRLPLSHSQSNKEQPTRPVGLESDLHEEATRKVLLHKQTDDGGTFNAFPNQDCNELLQSLFKGKEILSYNHEQKQMGLDILPTNNILMQDCQFPTRIQDPSLSLDQRHKRPNEVYLQQNVAGNIYTDNSQYLIPRQEHLPGSGVQEWNVNSVRMPGPLQSQLNNHQISHQNWFPSEHQVRTMWNGSDGVGVLPSQGIPNGGSSDQSLFSVLSQCSQQHSCGPFDSTGGAADHFITPRNSGMMTDVGASEIINGLPQAAYQLDYLSGRDPVNSLMPDDMSWINMQHQSSALHDPKGKPYMRPWDQ